MSASHSARFLTSVAWTKASLAVVPGGESAYHDRMATPTADALNLFDKYSLAISLCVLRDCCFDSCLLRNSAWCLVMSLDP